LIAFFHKRPTPSNIAHRMWDGNRNCCGSSPLLMASLMHGRGFSLHGELTDNPRNGRPWLGPRLFT
jgi:hypothetical protein